MSAVAEVVEVVEGPVLAVIETPGFVPQKVWNTLYPGETIADRRGFTQKDDPATAEVFQFMYGALTVYNQDDLDFILGIGPRMVREDIPQTSDPLVCTRCNLQTRSSRFFQVHQDKHF